MKVFFSFVGKEFRHILRDRRTILILLVMPIVQILLFGFAITTEVRDARVGVLAPRGDEMVRRVVQRLDASDYFTVVRTYGRESEVLTDFREGRVDLVLAFNEDNSALQLIADGSEPNQANMVVNYAQGILAQTLAELQSEDAGAAFAGQMPRVEVRMLYNPQQRSPHNFVPGVMGLILMLICAMMTSVAIVREHEQGTMEVLLASPLRPATIILAKLVPYFVLSMVNVGTILLLSRFVLDVPIVGSLWLLLGITLLFVMLSLCLGLLVSTLVRTQMAAMLASGMLMLMPVVLLSGMVFPVAAMPRVLQWLSCVVPARWFIQAVRRVMLQGAALTDVGVEVGVMAGMTLLLLLISWKNFKTRLA